MNRLLSIAIILLFPICVYSQSKDYFLSHTPVVIGHGNRVTINYIFERSADLRQLYRELDKLNAHYRDIPLKNERRRLEISNEIKSKREEIEYFKNGVITLYNTLFRIKNPSKLHIQAKEYLIKGEVTAVRDLLTKAEGSLQFDDDFLLEEDARNMAHRKINADIHLLKAQSEATNYLNENVFDTVVKYLQRSIRIFPYFENEYYYLQYLSDNYKFREAIEKGNQCISKYCEYKSDSIQAFIAIGNALQMIDSNNASQECYRLALRTYGQLSKSDSINQLPSLIDLYSNWAVLLHKQNIELERAKEYQHNNLLLLENSTKKNDSITAGKWLTTLTALGDICRKMRQYDSAHIYYKKGIDFYFKTIKYSPKSEQFLASYIAGIYASVGNIYTDVAKHDSALIYFHRAAYHNLRSALYSPAEYWPHLAVIYNNIGMLWSKRNNFDSAYVYYSEQLRLLSLLIDENIQSGNANVYLSQLADGYHNLGNLYAKKAKVDSRYYDSTKICFKKAIQLFQNLAAKDSLKYMPSLASDMNSLGILYTNLHQPDTALQFLRSAITIYKSLEAQRPEYSFYIANTLINVVRLYSFMERDFDSCIILNRESLERFRSLAAKDSTVYLPYVALVSSNMGDLYIKEKIYDSAQKYYIEAARMRHDLARVRPDEFLMKSITSDYNAAYVCNEMRDSERAKYYASRALDKTAKITNNKQITEYIEGCKKILSN